MSRIRNNEWEQDEDLQNDLEHYVKQNFKRTEVLDFMRLKYPIYAWSLSTLSRRLEFFDIKYIDREIDYDELERAVTNELDGPGSKLGYRALTKKVREVHGIKAPRDGVYDMLKLLDEDGLASRGGVGYQRRRKDRKHLNHV